MIWGDATQKKKKRECAQPGARTQDLSLDKNRYIYAHTRVFLAPNMNLLGERSNQTELAEHGQRLVL